MIRQKINSLGHFSRRGMCWIENSICNVPLNDGSVAICDEDRMEEVNKYSWHVNGAKPYPQAKIGKKNIEMHRFLYPTRPEGTEIDHINRNKIDNRSCNLRFCTRSDNVQNREKSVRNTTGFKGVHISKVPNYQHKKYFARVTLIDGQNKKRVVVGRFPTAEEAARAYDAKAKELYGEFAVLNFPNE